MVLILASWDAKNRRNILQGLQQTKSRLQRMHSDGGASVSGRSSLYPGGTGHQQRNSPSPSPSQNSGTRTGSLTTNTRIHTSPSPSDYVVQQQQQKAVLQASSQSYSFFISQPSIHGNFLMPVLPRFDSNGKLDTTQ